MRKLFRPGQHQLAGRLFQYLTDGLMRTIRKDQNFAEPSETAHLQRQLYDSAHRADFGGTILTAQAVPDKAERLSLRI